MKTRNELVKALGRLAVETGSLACLGCGWEHDCGVHGCAILRGVKAELEEETARAEETEAANHQLDGVVTTLMDSNQKLADAVKCAETRADEAEEALAAAVRDMEAMALTIRQRRDHDTECCPFCHYDCPVEDYCPGWEGEECFRWRGADRSRKSTGDLSRDATKMVHGVWISVENRLPHLREDVLVCAYWHEKWGVYSGWTNGKRWYVGCGYGTVSGIQVSHWMPLPLPPERSGSVDELE